MNTEMKTVQAILEDSFADDFEQICVFDCIDSTNAEAMRRMQAGHQTSQLIVAGSQTAGRGRRGRQWLSPAGGGIYLSLTRAFDRPLGELQGLSLVTALAVLETLLGLGLDQARVKWPNDILIDQRKLSGILLESCGNGGQQIIVFGIGINLALPRAVVADIDRPVTDLERELGRPVNTANLLVDLLENWHRHLASYCSEGFQPFVCQWNSFDRYHDVEIDIISGNTRISGIGRGVDATGALLLETASGLKTISGGELFPSVRPGRQE